MGYYANITECSKKLIRRFDTTDPFRIAEGLGIHVIFCDELKQLKGMYRVIKRNRFIFLNSKNSERMNQIVMAHELGHDQLHRDFAKTNGLQEFMLYDMTSRQEYEANLFAADLLLKDEVILNYIYQGFDTVQIANATGTDINLVALKVDCLNRNGHNFREQDHDSRFLKN